MFQSIIQGAVNNNLQTQKYKIYRRSEYRKLLKFFVIIWRVAGTLSISSWDTYNSNFVHNDKKL
jgi:hypothetical protein